MITFFTVTPIVIATTISYLFGFLWYSPFLFLKSWLHANGLTKDSVPKRSRSYMASVSLYSLIAHGAMSSVLALVFDGIQVTSYMVAFSVGGLLAFGFIVTTRYIDMLYTLEGNHYSRPQQIKFLISSGYYLVTVLSMSGVLFFFAGR